MLHFVMENKKCTFVNKTARKLPILEIKIYNVSDIQFYVSYEIKKYEYI